MGKALRQRRRRRVHAAPREVGRGGQVVVHGFGRGPEDAAAGHQGAHDHGDPLEPAVLRRGSAAHLRSRPQGEGQPDGYEERHQQQDLPVRTEPSSARAEAGGDPAADGVRNSDGRNDKGGQHPGTDAHHDPVDLGVDDCSELFFGCCAHRNLVRLRAAPRRAHSAFCPTILSRSMPVQYLLYDDQCFLRMDRLEYPQTNREAVNRRSSSWN